MKRSEIINHMKDFIDASTKNELTITRDEVIILLTEIEGFIAEGIEAEVDPQFIDKKKISKHDKIEKELIKMGMDEETREKWYTTIQTEYFGLTPNQYIRLEEGNIDHILENLKLINGIK